ncbi:MAG: hypothetical protein QM498_09280, partial [Desulfobacterium sp.]
MCNRVLTNHKKNQQAVLTPKYGGKMKGLIAVILTLSILFAGTPVIMAADDTQTKQTATTNNDVDPAAIVIGASGDDATKAGMSNRKMVAIGAVGLALVGVIAAAAGGGGGGG